MSSVQCTNNNFDVMDFFEDTFNAFHNNSEEGVVTYQTPTITPGSAPGGARVRRLSISFAPAAVTPATTATTTTEGYEEHWLADPVAMNQYYSSTRRPSVDFMKAMLLDETFELKEVNSSNTPHREEACFETEKEDLLQSSADSFAPLTISTSPSPVATLLSSTLYECSPQNISVTPLVDNGNFLTQQNYLQLQQQMSPIKLQIQPISQETIAAVPAEQLPTPISIVTTPSAAHPPPQQTYPQHRQAFYPIVPSPFTKGFNVPNTTLPINVQSRGFPVANPNKDVKKLQMPASVVPMSHPGKLPTPSKKLLKPKNGKLPSPNSVTENGKKNNKIRVDLRRTKTSRLKWTPELQEIFSATIEKLGIGAVPSTILEIMNVEGLTRENVASHLQKYRQHCIRGTTGRNKKMLKFNPDGTVMKSQPATTVPQTLIKANPPKAANPATPTVIPPPLEPVTPLPAPAPAPVVSLKLIPEVSQP